MYERPVIQELSTDVERNLCCTIRVAGQVVRTGLCPERQSFVTCRLPVSVPCTVSVGPVTISGQPG